jgi:soluble lytic murein transglycosylase-like protein
MLRGVVLLTVAALGVPAAAAQPVTDARAARAEAERAEQQVSELTRRLDDQLAARDEAMAALGSSVQRSVATETAADHAQRLATDARGRHSRTVRAFYRGGGQLGVYASVLDSGSLQDALDRTAMATRVLRWTSSGMVDQDLAADLAQQAAEAANQDATEQVVTVADVLTASEEIERTLLEAEEELARLSEEATRLEVAEQARRRLAAARARAAMASSTLGRSMPTAAAPVPAAYLALYQQAASRCPGMRWTLLAAVGQVESRHGRANGPSSAGAIGPMQFMPRTFAAYGVDGNGDGRADPWEPADAIHSAAVYLCTNGGGGSDAQVRRALLRYNNAQWYVDLVLGVEANLTGAGSSEG